MPSFTRKERAGRLPAALHGRQPPWLARGPAGAGLTVVQVLDGGVAGVAGVEVGHEGCDVLRGREHPVDDVPHEDKT